MKTEQEIRAKMERKLLKSFTCENEDVAKRWQAEAETLSWVLGMTAAEFDDLWEQFYERWQA